MNVDEIVQGIKDMKVEVRSTWVPNYFVSFMVLGKYILEVRTVEDHLEYTNKIVEVCNGKIISFLDESEISEENDPLFLIDDEVLEKLEIVLKKEVGFY